MSRIVGSANSGRAPGRYPMTGIAVRSKAKLILININTITAHTMNNTTVNPVISFIEGNLEVRILNYGEMQQQLWLWKESDKRERERASRKKIKCRWKSRETSSFLFFNVLRLRRWNNGLATVVGAEPFGGMSVLKVHTAPAPSTFRRQNVKACETPLLRSICGSCFKLLEMGLPS